MFSTIVGVELFIGEKMCKTLQALIYTPFSLLLLVF
jgi:hypothetical protein